MNFRESILEQKMHHSFIWFDFSWGTAEKPNQILTSNKKTDLLSRSRREEQKQSRQIKVSSRSMAIYSTLKRLPKVMRGTKEELIQVLKFEVKMSCMLVMYGSSIGNSIRDSKSVVSSTFLTLTSWYIPPLFEVFYI